MKHLYSECHLQLHSWTKRSSNTFIDFCPNPDVCGFSNKEAARGRGRNTLFCALMCLKRRGHAGAYMIYIYCTINASRVFGFEEFLESLVIIIIIGRDVHRKTRKSQCLCMCACVVKKGFCADFLNYGENEEIHRSYKKCGGGWWAAPGFMTKVYWLAAPCGRRAAWWSSASKITIIF